MTGHMPSSWRHHAWVQSWGTLCSEGLAWWAAPLLALIPGWLRVGRVCRASEWLSRIWPCGLSSPCHLGPHLFASGTLAGMSWRLQRAAASSNPLQFPCPPPLRETMHVLCSLAHLADTEAGRGSLDSQRGGGGGAGRKELGAIPGWARVGQGQCQGVRGRIHHPFHALSLCSLQPKAVSLTHSCLSPCFPNARGKSSCCCPLPSPVRSSGLVVSTTRACLRGWAV